MLELGVDDGQRKFLNHTIDKKLQFKIHFYMNLTRTITEIDSLCLFHVNLSDLILKTEFSAKYVVNLHLERILHEI